MSGCNQNISPLLDACPPVFIGVLGLFEAATTLHGQQEFHQFSNL